jgi:hypothetical protein
MPTDRLPHFAVFVMSVVALAYFLGASGLVFSEPQALHPSSTAVGRVIGMLIETAGTPRTGVEVFLAKAIVMECDSKGDFHHAIKLPAKPPFLVFTPMEDKPVATKTDLKGCFEFNAVQPGRYLLGIKRKDTPHSGESAYDSLYSGEAIVVFDLRAGQTLNAGRIFQKAR